MAAATPRRILVGMDSSGQAENALNAAIGLAERTDAELMLVHGVPSSQSSPEALVQARDALSVQCEAHISGARLPAGFLDERLLVEPTEHASQLVLKRAAEWQADLVVLGRHRPRGWLHFGNTVRGVLSEAPCPVWIQSGPVRALRRILVPVDLSRESLAALRLACAWAAVWDARLIVLHCFVPPELFSSAEEPMPAPTYVIDSLGREERVQFELVMAEFDFGAVPHELQFVQAEPVARILRVQDDVDLVMMGTHGRTGLSGALLGNVADSVLRSGHVPVVAFRHPERSWLLGADA
ncbi:MAG: hypothetical protein DRQ55_10755 [Planctomycetota bacterium]|nr:MAG: hypothetical protein DRQ55_10755 [Planctomycetota bacterium]